MATLFFASSLTLAYLNSNRQPTASLMDAAVMEEEATGSVAGDEIEFDLPPLPEAMEETGGADDLPVVPE